MMEPTRVGQFDDNLYNGLKFGDKSYIREAFKKHKDEFKRVIEQCIERQLWDWEKQIADSHDITKSSFGFK